MKKTYFYFIGIFIISIISFSCENSPAATCVGEYDGTYSHDSVVVGNAVVTAVESNSLTVNFVVTLESQSPFPINGVQVNGGGLPYTLYSSNTQGTLNGTLTSQDMVWTYMSSSDTISFYGVKQ